MDGANVHYIRRLLCLFVTFNNITVNMYTQHLNIIEMREVCVCPVLTVATLPIQNMREHWPQVCGWRRNNVL